MPMTHRSTPEDWGAHMHLSARTSDLSSYLKTLSAADVCLQINSTTNDTGKLFNWHPFLMALAFPLLMAEALLSYRAPLAPNLSV